jgi:hypothetical protein
MMKGGAREHEPVDVRDGNADIDTARKIPQHTARARTMDHEAIADACVAGRDNERLAVNDEPDMADEAFVENGIDGFAIVNTTFGQPTDFCLFGNWDGRIHLILLPFEMS